MHRCYQHSWFSYYKQCPVCISHGLQKELLGYVQPKPEPNENTQIINLSVSVKPKTKELT